MKTNETIETNPPGAQRLVASSHIAPAALAIIVILSGILMAGCFDSDDDDDDETDKIKLPSGQIPDCTIHITGLPGDFSISVAYMVADMDLLIREDTSMVNKYGNVFNHTYIGVDIYDLLKALGLQWNAGTVIFEAADGYAPPVNLYNLGMYYSELGKKDTHALLAFVEDGEWITEDNGGPVRVVLPDFASKYWVGNLANISVEPWSFEVTGAVNGTTDFSIDTFTAENGYNITEFFVEGHGTHGNTEATYTGVPLREVLNRTAPWDNATKVRVKCVDEYDALFNISDVMDNPESENPMILALEQDGNPMDVGDGLLQLIVPDDQYDDGDGNPDWFKNKWPKWIVEMEVIAG